jgi:hypothetical protein
MLERHFAFGYDCCKAMSAIRTLQGLRLARLSMAATLLLLIIAAGAFGQTMRPSATPPPNPSSAASNDHPKEDDASNDYGSPENEMRAKMILKEEKKRYDENVARAREVSQLASQVRESFEARQALSSDDGKRLERLEKLTKRIRNEAGGSDSDEDKDAKDAVAGMKDALEKVADMAGDLQKLVEKTPRWVVSTAVIDQANKLIGLVQQLRGVNH